MPAHVRKGDTVMVTSGDHKGQIGEILRVDPKNSRVLIKGINLKTKHVKPTRIAPQGGIITREAPMHMSKVSPVVDGKAVRVGFRMESDGSKVRVARHGGKELKVLGVVHAAREKSSGISVAKSGAKSEAKALDKPAKAAKPAAVEAAAKPAKLKAKKA